MTNTELLELRALREKLEKENRALAQKQKSFEYNVCLLEEKVSIEELEKKQKELKNVVSKLEAKKEELESKLTKKPVKKKKARKSKKVVKKLEDKKTVVSEEAYGENVEGNLTITTVVDSVVEEQKVVKKKRRFF